MKFERHNDNELLYLIKDCNNEEALKTLLDKYHPLIIKYVSSLQIDPFEFDDYVEEGRITLVLAVNKYNLNSSKSFMRFFELLLKRKYYNLYHKSVNQKMIIRNLSHMVENDDNIDYYDKIMQDERIRKTGKILRDSYDGKYVLPFYDIFILGHPREEVIKKYHLTRRKYYYMIKKIKKMIDS